MKALLAIIFLTQLGNAMSDRTAIIIERKFPTAFVEGRRAIPLNPTAEQIQLVEKRLAALLKAKHPKLFKKYFSYYRQYTGLEIGDEKKIIRGNFLCTVEGDRWQKEWILTFEGGDCYFNFTFDLGKSEITDFSLNGNG